ncbi:MAG TPA: amidase [Streptosporangiaceae bacterium]|jgi:amidase|nr:amidase [Streptosporangiaceae bacterium]
MQDASGVIDGSASVARLREALDSGALTSASLTAFYTERIRRLDPELHTVMTVSPDAAAEAEASDTARAAGRSRGPLDGIPVLVKDNIGVAGMPTTAGSPALLGAESADAFCVTRLREAGAVIIGKANLSEWANFRSTHATSGWSTLGGQVANPRGAGRNPSGSSSGSAAAVAAGLVPLAVGSETDGSIVCPASSCGIVGIKPTLGLVSRSGIVPVSLAQDTAGPMAGSVADAAALLSALAAVDAADPTCHDLDDRNERTVAADYAQFLDAGALTGARLGVWRAGSAAAGGATLAVLDAAIARLRQAGATVLDPVELPGSDKIEEPEFTALLHEFKRDLNAYLGALAGDHPATLADVVAFNQRHASTVLARFGQEIFERAEAIGDPGGPELTEARRDATRLARAALDQALAGGRLDAIIALTANPAWLTDYVLGDHSVFNTSAPAAVAGYPSVTVPAGEVTGLPVGLSFIGPAWSDSRLIALAHSFELSPPPPPPPGQAPPPPLSKSMVAATLTLFG